MRIPEHYNVVMPYLIVKGSSSFKKFMEDVFHAKEKMMVPTADGDNIMHGEMSIGDSVIMFAEASDEFTTMPAGMYVYVENCDATYEKALKCGAVVVAGQEPADRDYGRTCGVKDPFGNVWWMVEGSV